MSLFSVKKHLSAHMLNPKPQWCTSQPWPQGAHSSAIRTDQETNDCFHWAVTMPLQALLTQRRAPATRGAQSADPKPESA